MPDETECGISRKSFSWVDFAHIMDECPTFDLNPVTWKSRGDHRFLPSIGLVIDPTDHEIQGEVLKGFGLADFLAPIEQLCEEYNLSLESDNSGMKSKLLETLAERHLIVIVQHHGTSESILCSDGELSYDIEFDSIPIHSGCLISMSCWGNKAWVTYEEDDEITGFGLPESLQWKGVPCGFITINEGHYLQGPFEDDESRLLAFLIRLLLDKPFQDAWIEYCSKAPDGSHQHLWPFGDMRLSLAELIE